MNKNIEPLKCQTKTYFYVQYFNLEKYIQDLTGKIINIPCLLEATNGTNHTFTVDEQDYLDADIKKRIENFLFGEEKEVPEYQFATLLKVMGLHNLIQKGEYIIVCSW